MTKTMEMSIRENVKVFKMYEEYFSFLGTFRTPFENSRLQCWDGPEYEFPPIPMGWVETERKLEIPIPDGVILTVYEHPWYEYLIIVSEFGNTVEAGYIYPPRQRHIDSCCTDQPQGSYLRQW